MGTSTVGFVMVENSDFFEITNCITSALKKYNVMLPQVIVTPEIQYARIPFSVRINEGQFYDMETIETRDMSLYFNCHSDYYKIAKGQKIIWSLDCSGMSKEIIKHICQSMVSFGDVYFIPQDTNEDEWEKIKLSQ